MPRKKQSNIKKYATVILIKNHVSGLLLLY